MISKSKHVLNILLVYELSNQIDLTLKEKKFNFNHSYRIKCSRLASNTQVQQTGSLHCFNEEHEHSTNCYKFNFQVKNKQKRLERGKQRRNRDILLFPTLQSLPVTRRASVEKPLEEKKERREFQVTEEEMRSTPLLIKWPFSLNVDGSNPKARAMEPRSILWSFQTTSWVVTFEREGHSSFTSLFNITPIELLPTQQSLALLVEWAYSTHKLQKTLFDDVLCLVLWSLGCVVLCCVVSQCFVMFSRSVYTAE